MFEDMRINISRVLKQCIRHEVILFSKVILFLEASQDDAQRCENEMFLEFLIN